MAVKMALNGQLSLQGLCFLHLSIMVGGQALELRLMDGGHHCKGRVEVKYQGKWGTVDTYLWDLQDAAVVCRQLECGDAIDAPTGSYFGPGVGPIWLFNVSCEGTESALHDCSKNPIKDYTSDGFDHNWDSGVVCSGFVRLVGGHGPCSGQVEVHSGKEWTPVSDGNFTFLTAQVICAELGCGKAVSVLGHVPFRESDGQIWAEEFRCTREEPELWSCPRVPCPGGTCHHSGAVQVVCSAYTEVRLMKNGTSPCEGQVQMNISGGWKALCASHWTIANAHVVCRQLGCGFATSTPRGPYFVEGSDPIWKARFHCSGAESFLWNCPVTALGVPDCAHENTASVICSGNQTQVLPQCNDSVSEPGGSAASEGSPANCSDSRRLRLADGGGRCAGRVEILHQGSWGTICDDGWDLTDAHVVCRQLGCGQAVDASPLARFGAGSGPIWLDELNCTGKEPHVWRCPSRGWGRHDCRHKEDAGVVCSEFLALRMVSEDQECAGWLEVFYNGTWGSVCRSPMDDFTLSIVCSQLGCGDSGTLNPSVAFREGSRPRWVDLIQCRRTDTTLWECPSDPWKYNSCSPKEEAYVSCAGSRPKSCPTAAPCTDKEKLQLRGGGTQCSGRVEVWHSGSWGTVCDDSWSLAEAEVVCQQLGCGHALEALGSAAFGPGNGSIWLDEVQCRGSEPSLWACAAEPWGQNDCKHEEDAGVRCSGERTALPPATAGTRPRSNPIPGIFSLPGILCLILGALLFLVLVILVTQLLRWRVERRALSRVKGAVYEAVYEEIDYLARPKEDLLRSSGFLSDGSVSQLPYYIGDGAEDSDHKSPPEPPDQRTKAPSEGYDDAEEVPLPEAPPASRMREGEVPPEEETGMRASQTDSSLNFPREAADPGKGEESPWLDQWEKGDPAYDDVELSVPGTPSVAFPFCLGNPIPPSLCSASVDQMLVKITLLMALTCRALELRLMDGGHRCKGRVEVKHQGRWGTVNYYLWDLQDAAVVCRQLECGDAVDAPTVSYFGPGVGPIWLFNVSCEGTESALHDCSKNPIKDYTSDGFSHNWDSGAVCSGFMRLVGGHGPCSGQVEMHSGKEWTPVSDGNFTFLTAQVICAELGCGKAVSVLGHMPFRRLDGRVWEEEFACTGEEPELWFCPRVPCPGGTCHHSGAVQVVCSAYTEVRLMKNDTSQCEGRVEMNISGGWRALCASHWTMANAHVVCRQLGCGVATSTPRGPYFVEGSDPIWKARFHCSGAESFLWNCPVTALGAPDCAHGNTASVICSGNQTQVLPQCNDSVSEPGGSAASEGSPANCSDSRRLRLADGGGRCAGRVEILHQGSWGTICDDGWDLTDAHVVCRQLGCGQAVDASPLARFGAGSGPIWLDELNCTGKEPHVWRCPSRGWGRHDCRHKEDAGVVCSEFLALRMVSEDQECAGWLEVFYNGTWGSVCHSPMDDITLSIVCSQLGCGDSGTLNPSVAFREGSRPRWVDLIQCRRTDTTLWECPSDPWKYDSCSPKEEAYISCAGSRPKSCPTAAPCTDKEKLRLRGGGSQCSGRVEVWHSGSWGTVCDDSWSLAEAEVVCQQLGCGHALEALGSTAFGPGNGSIWLDEVQCRGSEPSLWACAAESWGQNDCKHEEDAGVRCSGERTTLPPATAGTRPRSNPIPGIFSLPGILCLILGALLFLVLVILVTQLLRWRAERRALSRVKGAVYEAVYEEIDYLATPKEDLLHSSGFLSDDSVSQLPYYIGDGAEDSDHKSTPEPPDQRTKAPSEGYDDAEEVPLPEAPPASRMREGEVPPEEETGMRASQTDSSLNFPREAADPGKGEERPWLDQWGKGDHAYDDVELSVPGTPSVAFPWVFCSWDCALDDLGVRMFLNGHLSLQGLCFLLLSIVVGGQALEVRLKGGRHRCEGRVEMKHQGTWGMVYFEYWFLDAAEIVCGHLKCGHAVDAPRGVYFGPTVGPIWTFSLQCNNTEAGVTFNLNDCTAAEVKNYDHIMSHDQDIGAVCSGFVHLVGGHGPCSGQVEVRSEEDWTTVSDGNFTFLTAQVICADLGCGKAVSVLGHMPFRRSDGRVWEEQFGCTGEESELWSCPRVPCPGGTCHHSGAVQVVCSAYTEVRLMKNDTSQCEGRVEMNISGGWRALCASHWTMANAHVICRQLGCGVATSIPTGPYLVAGSDPIWKARFHCSGAESFLWNCPLTALGAPDCAHGNTASVICSGNQTQVLPQCDDSVSEPGGSAASEGSPANCSDSRRLRLADGGGRCAGRVEILHQGSWGTICDDGWDLTDAHVVCRQLGCGQAVDASPLARFGAGSGPIWLDELNCTGKEPHVWRCPSRGWGRHDCRHKEDAGVVCSEFLALRMVSEDQECAGWLEVFYNGTWGSVCRSRMDEITLSIVCSQLGCGDMGQLDTSVALREGSRPRWVDLIQCRRTDTSLWECPSDPWKYDSCSPKEEAYISCAGSRTKSCPTAAPCTDKEKLRLRGGGTQCSGRVEVWHSGSWGTVCDDSWSLAEAEVVCQQLGCGHALEALGSTAFGPGNGSIWLDEVQCRGSEPSLWVCAAEPWGQNDCKHEEDAGVRCSGERTTLPPATAGTRPRSNPIPGIFSLPGILCLILGTLLFLVLVILVTQLLRWRAERRALSTVKGAVHEAVYEEIDQLVTPKEDLLRSSDDSMSQLPYYTGDAEEDSDHKSTPEPLDQRTEAPSEGYDDAEEVPLPEAPPASRMSKGEVPPEEETGMRPSQTDSSLNFPREAADPGKGEESPWLDQWEKGDPGYDDVELSVPGTPSVAFP
ncbi:antigen WC1.1 [Camelus ferus]|uniref:Antigen WC1.1 n=1 Tax=Camelus ferus TaxID=419612 RepID=A0A8B8SG65_CAMFR|nr:antigen WC1.1 [Camelus ferus]